MISFTQAFLSSKSLFCPSLHSLKENSTLQKKKGICQETQINFWTLLPRSDEPRKRACQGLFLQAKISQFSHENVSPHFFLVLCRIWTTLFPSGAQLNLLSLLIHLSLFIHFFNISFIHSFIVSAVLTLCYVTDRRKTSLLLF